jgi:hypothetical protein|nr:MAG TPA: Six-cysteine peptide SCIFF [Caudoviricetes sp.]
MPNRGKYKYADPAISDSYKEKKLDGEFVNQVNYLATRLKYQASELKDIVKVRNNPQMYPDRYYEMKGQDISEAAFKNDLSIFNTTDSGEKLTLAQFNKIIKANWDTYSYATTLFSDQISGLSDLPKFTENEVLSHNRFMQIMDNYNKINDYLNRNWNKYFDGSGYCILSCQVACQAACQLGCQSCQYNTCHNQNCGGWS